MNTRRAAVIVILVTLSAFATVVTHDFTTWDDNYNIVQNPHVNPPSFDGLKYLWTHEWMHLWIPLTYTVWIAIASIDLNPHLFHTANLLIHVGAAIATLALLRRLKFSVAAATIGALIFAVHPVQVESVAWISGLKDVLSGLLCILAILFHVNSKRSWTLATFTLAMLAKPSAVALPVVILVIDRFLLDLPMKRSLKTIAPMLILAIPFIVLGKLAQPASLVEHVPLWWRPLIAGEALAFYLWKLIWPFNLAVDYGHSPSWVMRSGVGYFAWIAPIALIFIARARPARAAIGVIIAALLPVLGLVTFDFQEKSTVADHYLYPAMLGVAIGIAALFDWARPSLRPILVVMIALLGVRSFVQSRTWADSRTLFTHAIAVNPQSAIAYNNLYVVAMDERNGVEAESHARKMLALKPDDMLSITNLAGAVAMQERYVEAEQLYRDAAKRWPGNVDPHVGLGLVLLDQNRPRDAVESFDAALRIAPGAPNIISLRAKAQQAIQP